MFQNYYHCLIAGLPDLFLDETEVSFSLLDFKENLETELAPRDFELVKWLFLDRDNKNLLNILQENYDNFDKLGNFTLNEFEREMDEDEALHTLPQYMYDVIAEYKENKGNRSIKQWENLLASHYFDYVLSANNSFLKAWFEFEMNVKNILTGVNCRKFERDPEEEILGDNFVAEAVRRSNAKDFGLDVELEYAGHVIGIAEKTNLLSMEKSMDQFRWEQVNELTRFNYFSIEVVLAYVIKLEMIYRWMQMDEKTGKEMFKKLIDELKDNFEFSKEFMINEQRK